MKRFKNDLRYNEDGYFSLDGWFEKLKIDVEHDVHVLIITAPRNMGKTQGTWKWIYNNYWLKHNHKRKMAYVRTNDIKMKEALGTFKSAFNGIYCVSGTGIIYDYLKPTENKKIDKTTMKEIGRFINVENEHNYRSGVNSPHSDGGGFNNYNFVFWDEFNEAKQTKVDLYQKFLMLLSTIKRKNKPFILLLIGNKIDANNDIFVKLNLNTNDHDLNCDYIQKVESNITYLDIGYDTYSHLDECEDDIVKRLAKYDTKTNRLFNDGGFLYAKAPNVRNCKTFCENELEVIGYYSFQGFYIEYGKWLNKDKIHYYLREIESIENIKNSLKMIALDSLGYTKDKDIVKVFDFDDLIDLANKWYLQLKKGELFFDSFILKFYLEEWIIRFSTEFEE